MEPLSSAALELLSELEVLDELLVGVSVVEVSTVDDADVAESEVLCRSDGRALSVSSSSGTAITRTPQTRHTRTIDTAAVIAAIAHPDIPRRSGGPWCVGWYP
ncbi:hypothetical protein [Janibacter alkaliphilus]|uniref:Uncharacterized protein n=1 Tax=Janibacter alkaliphilus TaxID=1069963 RepID=A0A852X1T0_9MICO|nr:hypothetical protein [Janibacter alkaliphilus]NYG36829.1 hypothetical protein [Janibacter alkaliphilus]